MTRFLLALATLAVSTSPAIAQPAVAPELAKISIAFAAAFNAKDAAKLGTFYVDDAVLMPPGGPMVKGRAAIEAAFQQQFAAGITGLKLVAVEARVAGDQAFEAGTSSMTIGAGPKAVAGRGKYVVVYTRVGGVWKIRYDIFNDDGPAAPAAR